MGRHRKLGNEVCPVCSKPGRPRFKNIRGRPDERYLLRCYFHHNDKGLQDHCIPGKKGISTVTEAFGNVIHKMVRIADTFDRCNLSKDEEKRLESAMYSMFQVPQTMMWMYFIECKMSWYDRNGQPIPKDLELQYNRVREIRKHVQMERDSINRACPYCVSKYLRRSLPKIYKKTGIVEFRQLYEKYLLPEKIEMIRRRNKLLSEAHFGSEKNRYNDFTGLAEIISNE